MWYNCMARNWAGRVVEVARETSHPPPRPSLRPCSSNASPVMTIRSRPCFKSSAAPQLQQVSPCAPMPPSTRPHAKQTEAGSRVEDSRCGRCWDETCDCPGMEQGLSRLHRSCADCRQHLQGVAAECHKARWDVCHQCCLQQAEHTIMCGNPHTSSTPLRYKIGPSLRRFRTQACAATCCRDAASLTCMGSCTA